MTKSTALNALLEQTAPKARKGAKQAPAPQAADEVAWGPIVAAWQASKAIRKEAEAEEKRMAEALKAELVNRGGALTRTRIEVNAGEVSLALRDVKAYVVEARTDKMLQYRGK